MRSIWKGHIRFSLVTIPVRIYSATETSESISFNQLHKDDYGRIGYDKRCKKCGEIVNMSDIVKGYQYKKDEYVIVEPEDLEKIKLASTKVIEIEGFLSADEITPMLYDTPYFAGPDGTVAGKAYSLLCQTLKETGKIGVGRVVIRDREDVVLIAPQEEALIMYKIRYPMEIRDIKEIPMLQDVKVNKNELKLAENLVESMTTHINELEIADRYQSALKEMIEAKLEGKEVTAPKEESVQVIDLMAALKQSLNKAKDTKAPMEKAKGRKKPVRTKAKKQA